MHTLIKGTFVKISTAKLAHLFLAKNSPERPAARYNRVGENALYLSKNETTARTALQKYKLTAPTELVLIEYELSSCNLVDLRKPEVQELYALSRGDWKEQLNKGQEPDSWKVSDLLRSKNAAGLIDPSRKNVEHWHLVLFKWNEPEAPKIAQRTTIKPITL